MSPTTERIIEGHHLLLHCRSGSHAYGLATERSDEDFRGVFAARIDSFLGLDHPRQLSDERNDRTYYELGRLFELLGKANPTALELLGTDGADVLYKHPLLADLRAEAFLSKACRDSFAGYALTQIRKARGLNKKVHNPVAPERKGVEDFCYIVQEGKSRPLRKWAREHKLPLTELALAGVDHARDLYAVYHDRGAGWAAGITRSDKANAVAVTDVPEGELPVAYLSFSQDAYSTYCRDYREYRAWERNRNDARYRGTLAHGRGYDAKNMMHTIRLLEMATEIFTTGRLNVRRPNRSFLLSIRAGEYSLDEVLRIADERVEQLNLAAARSDLPHQVDSDRLNRRLVGLRRQLYYPNA
ncbi:putative nucleotidyltransferase [Neolewinella xylanilytica]|uniref:Putative nucleotidyltransferase n=1 Tax=Neolewinella xylanilytica TaxID=1514080 RepID=A0A2S6I758_9BACT|nr:nucleotidyltransferase domain-containing protein [Neolewinella xylanilytica]PPK87289.1 putative nucleotidyltransferase [Neolewinella xylanilytica]